MLDLEFEMGVESSEIVCWENLQNFEYNWTFEIQKWNLNDF